MHRDSSLLALVIDCNLSVHVCFQNVGFFGLHGDGDWRVYRHLQTGTRCQERTGHTHVDGQPKCSKGCVFSPEMGTLKRCANVPHSLGNINIYFLELLLFLLH